MGILQKLRAAWLRYNKIVFLFVIINIAYSVVAYAGWFLLPHFTPYAQITSTHYKILDVWTRWDGMHYLSIVKDGYGVLNESNVTFFPLYPLLIKLLNMTLGLDYVYGALIVARASFLFLLIVLYDLVQIDFKDEKIAFRTVLYLSIFPSSLFFIAAYTESLFLLLILLAFKYARNGKWPAACIFAMLSSATRSIGVIMALALLIEYMHQRDFKLNKIRPDILFLAIVPFGLAGFMAYLYGIQGDALAFKHAEAAYGRHLNPPWIPIYKNFLLFFKGITYSKLTRIFAIRESVFSLAFLAMFYPCFKKIRLSYCVFMVFAFFIPFSTSVLNEGLSGMVRYVLILFPVFMYMATLGRRKWFHYSYVIIAPLLGIIFICRFANWFWLG